MTQDLVAYVNDLTDLYSQCVRKALEDFEPKSQIITLATVLRLDCGRGGMGEQNKAGRWLGKLLPQSKPKAVKVCTIMGIVRIIRIFAFSIDLEDKANWNH